ncbi:MAG: septation protein SpoVG family protein [Candidatus Omnitrophica bacterium]|nr:septation protein SpoVG family protein [Candidatus Omnitrophota bacterium]
MEDQVNIEVDRIYRFENGSHLKAFADIVVGGQFAIKGFRIVEGKKGLFVSMPSDIGKNGNWYNTFKPITKEASLELNKVILGAYQQE